MAMHAARRVALQMIYCGLLGGENCGLILEEQEDNLAVGEDQVFVDQAVQAVQNKQREFGEKIQAFSPDRALDRIPVLNLAILYLALYELSLPDALPGVIVNEAVELAKRFGEESDRRFINGVLGRMLREQPA